VTRLFEKEYGLPVNSNPTDPRSRVRTFRMAALCSPIIASRQHRLHSSNRCVGRTLTVFQQLHELIRREKKLAKTYAQHWWA
jgi:hypothetical protein